MYKTLSFEQQQKALLNDDETTSKNAQPTQDNAAMTSPTTASTQSTSVLSPPSSASQIPPQHYLSPASSTTSTTSRHSKSSVVAAAHRRKRMGASPLTSPMGSAGEDGSYGSDTSSLQLPTLQQQGEEALERESRNDHPERKRLQSLVHVKSEDGELEVSLKHPLSPTDNSVSMDRSITLSPPGNMSPETLERKTKEIILEAQTVMSQLTDPLTPQPVAYLPQDPKSKKLLQEAMDRAAGRQQGEIDAAEIEGVEDFHVQRAGAELDLFAQRTLAGQRVYLAAAAREEGVERTGDRA